MSGETERLGEFDLIERLFAPLSGAAPGAFRLTDDAAVIASPDGHDVVMTKDMMVAGVHFLPDDPADQVARKLLRVNLSDLAAMGAAPHGYALGISLPPDIGDDWLTAFAAGLAQDQGEFGVALLGGDTTSTPGPLTLSLTAFGFARHGRLLRRAGARPGDLVCVSGTIGDAALGLQVLRGRQSDPSGFLARRYRLPSPRVALGQLLPGLASAGLDVSDGLVADLGHLCTASGVGARIMADTVPLSTAARALVSADPRLIELVMTGGDDYELVFSLPPGNRAALEERAAGLGIPVAMIGVIVAGKGVRVEDVLGVELTFERPGFRHR
jgi:thiamine-monophosphate kinase